MKGIVRLLLLSSLTGGLLVKFSAEQDLNKSVIVSYKIVSHVKVAIILLIARAALQ